MRAGGPLDAHRARRPPFDEHQRQAEIQRAGECLTVGQVAKGGSGDRPAAGGEHLFGAARARARERPGARSDPAGGALPTRGASRAPRPRVDDADGTRPDREPTGRITPTGEITAGPPHPHGTRCSNRTARERRYGRHRHPISATTPEKGCAKPLKRPTRHCGPAARMLFAGGAHPARQQVGAPHTAHRRNLGHGAPPQFLSTGRP